MRHAVAPGNHFVALGGGRKLGALVQNSIKRPPLLFRRTTMQKGRAYNRASTVHVQCITCSYHFSEDGCRMTTEIFISPG